MNKERKKKSNKIKFIMSKIAQAVVTVEGMATITACTILLHEKKVSCPSYLINYLFAEKNNIIWRV